MDFTPLQSWAMLLGLLAFFAGLFILLWIGAKRADARADERAEIVFKSMRSHPSTGPHPMDDDDYDAYVRIEQTLTQWELPPRPDIDVYDWKDRGDFSD